MKVVILGGAGFIGSLIAKECVHRGHETIVVDGLLPKTGGRSQNLECIINKIKFIPNRIEETKDLEKLLLESDLAVCAMAWTSHISAMEDPEYDIELNLLSHVRLLRKIPVGAKLIYLGSRSQYGNIPGPITEDSPMKPLDVQGINKTAAESYYRIFSSRSRFDVVSMRLPNCFGQNQPVSGSDIGLIGSMISDLISGKKVKVYGNGRMRSFLYVDDCARIVCDIAENGFSGFNAYNVGGIHISIAELVRKLAGLVGAGDYEIHEIPDEIKRIDFGNAPVDEGRLRKKLGVIKYTEFDKALFDTISYFKKELVV